ncbi:MAG: ABC transporter permease [Acidimicrobiales bacterium]
MSEVRAEEGPSELGAFGGPIPTETGTLGDAAKEIAALRRDHPRPTRVVAARVSLRTRLRELWAARELFAFLVRKEIKVKYKNSVLGFAWSMLNPALNLAVFFVLFTYFLPNHIPHFVIYMFSAMLIWNLFQTSVMSGTGAVVNNAGIVKKVAFPREILALASVGSAFVFFMFQAIVMVFFMVVFWHRPAWGDMWMLALGLLAIALFASAMSVFLSAVNVYLRDTQHFVEVALMAWFWACPGIYAFSGTVHNGLVRHHLLWIYFLNPVTPVVMTFQRFFYATLSYVNPTTHQTQRLLASYGTHWYVAADLAVAAISLVLLLGALVVFGRLEGNFAEEL